MTTTPSPTFLQQTATVIRTILEAVAFIFMAMVALALSLLLIVGMANFPSICIPLTTAIVAVIVIVSVITSATNQLVEAQRDHTDAVQQDLRRILNVLGVIAQAQTSPKPEKPK